MQSDEARPEQAQIGRMGFDRAGGTPGSDPHAWWPGTPQDLSFDAMMSGTAYIPLGGADFPRIQSESIAGTRDAYVATRVTDPAELEEILALRREVYSKHGRPVAIETEEEDHDPINAVFAVRDLDGELFATMRVSFNLDGKADWQEKFSLPPSYRHLRLASFERLAIRGGGLRAIRAKQALFKVAFLLSLAVGTHWVVIATVAPLNRLFENLGFINIFGPGRQVKLPWYGDPMYVLALRSDDSGITLLNANRPWYNHIVSPDPGCYATLSSYFEREGHRKRRPSVAADLPLDPVV